ncbi:hypothetical protein A7A08_03006 [Methyloligella halotolerans]|uniref:Uncharacterized protein n=1 Tax=Methyloligella halotolerans TaxID=1177755 RepID=A0A1E2RVB3_9HYPH|nr:hypothetical protein [Methyloligella halotolerans]ODA66153.1 hypothetical protein A7A08_03006 [Methyloligella halotolerans]
MQEGQEFTFRIEVLEDHGWSVEDVMAGADQLLVAYAAFHETVKQRPGRRVVPCQRARIIAKSWE